MKKGFTKNYFLSRRERVGVRGQKFAFTLAEVLITLGIIGVVAAITLPTLIQNYQKTVWVNQLKKSVNIVENGFYMAMAKDNVFNLEDTEMIVTSNSEGEFDRDAAFQNFVKYFGKYVKVLKTQTAVPRNAKHLKGESSGNLHIDKIYFADGSYFALGNFTTGQGIFEFDKKSPEDCESIKQKGGSLCFMLDNEIYIDVNGDKKPNQYGRDMFVFVLSNDGKLYPKFGKDYALFQDPATDYVDNSRYWKNSINCDSTLAKSSGITCAARIIESGWVMDY